MLHSQRKTTKHSVSLLLAFLTTVTIIVSSVSACDDVPPSPKYTCQQQAQWNKCNEPWMKNKCKKSCNRCSGGGGANTDSLSSLDLAVPGDLDNKFKINALGPNYLKNKHRVMKAFRSVGLSGANLKLCLAIAMQETNTLDPKDFDGQTFSFMNYNYDMLNRIGFPMHEHRKLNSWSGLSKTALACKLGIEKFKPYGFVNFHRGGATGWQDPSKYECNQYRNEVATIIRFLDKDSSLMADDRRVTLYP